MPFLTAVSTSPFHAQRVSNEDRSSDFNDEQPTNTPEMSKGSTPLGPLVPTNENIRSSSSAAHPLKTSKRLLEVMLMADISTLFSEEQPSNMKFTLESPPENGGSFTLSRDVQPLNAPNHEAHEVNPERSRDRTDEQPRKSAVALSMADASRPLRSTSSNEVHPSKRLSALTGAPERASNRSFSRPRTSCRFFRPLKRPPRYVLIVPWISTTPISSAWLR